LTIAIICLLLTYKEDFYQPPHHPLLRRLRAAIAEQDLHTECTNLSAQFDREGDPTQTFHSGTVVFLDDRLTSFDFSSG
jgi:hypothetical protein